jgi:hypothetical protein
MLKKLSVFLGLLLIFVMVVLTFYAISEKLRFNAIVIHHTASAVDNYHSIAVYQRQEHGWRDAAYHLILSNGSTNVPAGYLEPTGRYRFLAPSVATKNMYYNLHAIHICIVGEYDKHEMPKTLQVALVDVLRQLQEKYGIADDRILFHRDCSSSSCPGRFITKAKLQQWLAAETSQCPVFLSRQHEKVIGGEGELIYSVQRKVDGFGARAFGVLKSILISCRQLA